MHEYKILVVDDEQEITSNLNKQLTEQGFQVKTPVVLQSMLRIRPSHGRTDKKAQVGNGNYDVLERYSDLWQRF